MASQSALTTHPTDSRFKRVCIYGGREPGRTEVYKHAALELAQELIHRNLNLVYGGGVTGLVGSLAQAMLDARKHVLSIVQTTNQEAVGEQKVVLTPHQQKIEMVRHADCFIVLPRGFETMEEFMETVCWAQLGIHDKPVGLLNVGGFFDDFFAFIDTAIENDFIKPSQKGLIVLGTNAGELLEKMEGYRPTHEGALPKELWEAEAESSSSRRPTNWMA